MPMPTTPRYRRLLPAALSLGALAAAVLLVAACSPTTVLNALAPRDTATVTADVAYADGDRRKLDIWRPAAAAPAGGWPVVVFFYGGTWNQGDRAEYRFVGEALAARGILTLIADYRLYPEVPYPDFMRRQREGARLGARPCPLARRRPETRVRLRPQRRRLQRRHAGARRALAEGRGPCAVGACRLGRPGRTVRLLSEREPRRQAGVPPSGLSEGRPADRAHHRFVAAGLPRRGEERQAREPAAQAR